MKRLLFTITVLCFAFATFGQSGLVDLFVKLTTPSGEPIKYTKVSIVDKSDNQTYIGVTDSKGTVRFDAFRLRSYEINIEGKTGTETLTIPARGMNFVTKTIVYTPSILQDKSAPPDTIVQQNGRNAAPTQVNALVVIQLSNLANRRLHGEKLRLYCASNHTVYVAETDAAGEAKFLVPNGKSYQLGIHSFDNFQIFNIPAKGGIGMVMPVQFEETDITETLENDTIMQQLSVNVKPTTMRALVDVTIRDLNGNLLETEDIYCNVENSSKVYTAITDNRGNAKLMLPKGDNYILSFKYERNIDLLEYPMSPSFHTTKIQYSYIGSQVVEEHYKNAKRNENGFKNEFLESKVTKIGFDRDLFEKTDFGYQINFDDNTISTPLFANNNMYVGSGYYNTEFYSFEAESGNYRWGLRLSDNGPSSAVYSDGVIIMNTESCTLYAVDAYAGNLLWSKWLGPYLYSTPTVAAGKVIAVYPDDLILPFVKYEGKFVLVAFDIKTGEVVWQNRINEEVLAAPVFYEDAVYVTTLKGTLYQFNEQNGELIAEVADAKAISPPTVFDDKLYVSTRHGDEQLVTLYNRNGLKKIKDLQQLKGKLFFDDPYEFNILKLMNHNGSRITHYKGKNYNVMNNCLICSEPETGNILWKRCIDNEQNEDAENLTAMPVVTNGYVIVPALDGQIHIFDAEYGNFVKKYSIGSQMFSQPVVHNGWIYSGSNNGKVQSVDTGMNQLTGWSMWSLNEAHNPVIK